jgi:hypothetical protein
MQASNDELRAAGRDKFCFDEQEGGKRRVASRLL